MAITTVQPTRTRRVDVALRPARPRVGPPPSPAAPVQPKASGGRSRLATVVGLGAVAVAVVVFVAQLR
ncbi:MAG: hypothetical protein QOD31_1997, partial [Pseudonocardiales bacterium]|nr:hypothetical protein [Pseudonocardiales bacterium]